MITEKLVSRVLRDNKIHYSHKEHDTLQQLFQTLFVLPSADKGLLGDTSSFRVIGDGSPVQTGARSLRQVPLRLPQDGKLEVLLQTPILCP